MSYTGYLLQVKELILKKDPSLLDSFLEVSNGLIVYNYSVCSCIRCGAMHYLVDFVLTELVVFCVLFLGGDSFPRRSVGGCEEICGGFHGGCMVTGRNRYRMRPSVL